MRAILTTLPLALALMLALVLPGCGGSPSAAEREDTYRAGMLDLLQEAEDALDALSARYQDAVDRVGLLATES
jgi:hypothetical protein